jgi:hypothetical protein
MYTYVYTYIYCEHVFVFSLSSIFLLVIHHWQSPQDPPSQGGWASDVVRVVVAPTTRKDTHCHDPVGHGVQLLVYGA